MKQFEPGTFIKTQLVQYVSHDLQTRWQKDDESAAASSRLMHSVIHARMILEFMNRSESLLTRTANLLRCALSDPVELLACILLLRIRGGELDAERYEFYVYQTFKHWQQVIRQLQQDLEKMPVTVEYLPLGRLFQLTPVQDKLCFWLDLNLVSDLRRIQPAKIFCILGEGGRAQLERFERLLTDGFLKEDD